TRSAQARCGLPGRRHAVAAERGRDDQHDGVRFPRVAARPREGSLAEGHDRAAGDTRRPRGRVLAPLSWRLLVLRHRREPRAGACMGGAPHVREPPLRALPLGLAVIATVVVAGGVGVARHHAVDLARYARPATLNSMTFDAWQAGSYGTIASARTEIKGEGEEPFAVQWVAPRSEVIRVLLADGWQVPVPWTAKSTLLWMVTSTPIGELPVLPKFHHGEPPALTLVRPIDRDARAVLRFWRVAEVARLPRAGAPPSDTPVTLYVVMATNEELGDVLHFVLYVRT